MHKHDKHNYHWMLQNWHFNILLYWELVCWYQFRMLMANVWYKTDENVFEIHVTSAALKTAEHSTTIDQ